MKHFQIYVMLIIYPDQVQSSEGTLTTQRSSLKRCKSALIFNNFNSSDVFIELCAQSNNLMRSNMKKPFLRLLVATVFFPKFAFAQWSLGAAPEFMVESGWQLRFNLVYSGAVAINTDRSFFPWGIRNSIELHATTSPFTRPVTELEEANYIDDLRYNPVTISPGDEIHGAIQLQTRFPTLAEVNKNNSIVLCYRYSFSWLGTSSKDIKEECFLLEPRQRPTRRIGPIM